MNLNCGAKTIKYLILSFNFLFLITGIILVGVGASIKAYYTQYDLFLDDKYFTLPNLLIATGSLIFMISFLGCYGAMKESWILLLIYSFLLAVIFIFEFSAGIAGYVLRDKTSSYLESTMLSNMILYGNENNQGITKMWDIIQEQFECCGVSNLEDWQNIFENKSHSLPVSCCPQKYGTIGEFSCYANVSDPVTTLSPTSSSISISTSTTTGSPTYSSTEDSTDSTTSNNTFTSDRYKGIYNSEKSISVNSTTPPYQVGCETAFGSYVKAHAVDIGGVGFALAVIQLIGIVFSCYLSRRMKNSYYST